MPSCVASFIAPMSTLLNPAVRVCTDWKNPARILAGQSRGPRVAGFDHSITVMYTVPATSRTAVAKSTMRVFIVHRRIE